jgi:hypothetical protein
VRVLTTKHLDGRSVAAVGIKRFTAEVVRDLGGDPSAQQRAVLEVAARTKIMLDAIDDWLLRQPSLLLKQTRALIPALAQRQQLADSFARHMQALGLGRKARAVPDIRKLAGLVD